MLLLFLLQTLQSFVFFIPAFAIQVYAGYLNPILGPMIIYISFILSNLYLFKKLPKLQIVNKWFNQNHTIIHQYKIIFTIPIIPNIIKPYIAKHNNLTTKQFLKQLTYTNVPTILLSTIIGGCIFYKNYSLAIILSIFYALLILFSFIYLFLKSKKR